MTCREDILVIAHRIITQLGKNEFEVKDIVEEMHKMNSKYKDSTIRTHVVASMCYNAPKNHINKSDDLERIGRGLYRLRKL